MSHPSTRNISRLRKLLCNHTLAPRKSRVTHLRPLLVARAYSTPSEASDSGTSKTREGYARKIVLGTTGLAVLLGIYVISRSQSKLQPESPTPTAFAMNYASSEELQLAIRELRDTFPDRHAVTTDPGALRLYGSSENSYHPTSPHSVVVCVHGTEDVVKVVNISRKYRVPITAYSGATSLEGHFAGVCHDSSSTSWYLTAF